MSRLLVVLAILVFLTLSTQSSAAPGDENWLAMGGAADGVAGGPVRTMLAVGNDIYVAGGIYAAGDVAGWNSIIDCTSVVKWDGVSWSCLGSGIDSMYVNALASDANGNIYAAGSFASADGVLANNIAMWNGSAWLPLGTGVNGLVTAMALDNTNNFLYVSGFFYQAGEQSVESIARWDGNAWSVLDPDSFLDSAANSMVVDANGILYVGQSVSKNHGEEYIRGVASWDGTSWHALGSGVEGIVTSLALTADENLVVGGDLQTAGGLPTNSIAVWNGSNWAGLGVGISGVVSAVEVGSQGEILVAGDIGIGADIPAQQIAKWSGVSWSVMGSSFSANIWDLLMMPNGQLYTAGEFYSSGTTTLNLIAEWKNEQWWPLSSGLGAGVTTLAADDDGNIFAGVVSSTAMGGGVPLSYVGRWNGRAWSSVGNPNFFPESMVYDSQVNSLYVGGGTGKISRWDGASWIAVGADFNGDVTALAVDGAGNLYAGGDFTMAGATPANHIAKWDGVSWSAVGAGTEYGVTTLLYSGGNLYVSDIADVYQWNGLNLAVMGQLSMVQDFAVGLSGEIFAASMHGLFEWNGSEWISIDNFSASFDSVAVDAHGVIYVGGTFDSVNGVPAKNIASFDGINWHSLASGVDDASWAFGSSLHVSSKGDLYAAGWFDFAGGKSSSKIAVWTIDGDHDGYPDSSDPFPFDPTEWADTDSDGLGNNADTTPNGDTDNDGIDNAIDNCISVSNADQLNTDGDAQGNACDTDDDNDGVADVSDAFPLNANESVDVDSDTIGDNADNCVSVSNVDQLNTDGDTQGNACDNDDDNDGIADTADAFPLDATQSADTDSDTIGDSTDNCVAVANTNQLDTDADGAGDVCDNTPNGDADNDGVDDLADNCPLIANSNQLDWDSDGNGDRCDDPVPVPADIAGVLGKDKAGSAVAFAGDFNGDGYGDYVIGIPAYDVPATLTTKTIKDAGRAEIISGKDGSVLASINGVAAKDAMGFAVAGNADVNDDGFDDVVVGAPLADHFPLKDTGSVTVLYGRADISPVILSNQVFYAATAKTLFGSALALGNANWDYYADIIVGAPKADDLRDLTHKLVDAGSVTIIDGNTLAALPNVYYGSTAKAYAGTSVAAGNLDVVVIIINGRAVGIAGNVDIIVGAPNDDDIANKLKDTGSVTVYNSADAITPVMPKQYGAVAKAYLGKAVAAGNIDGVAGDEVLAGAPGDDVPATVSTKKIVDAGSVTVFFADDAKQPVKKYGAVAKANLGSSVEAGDVNNDGYADIIAGAAKDDLPTIPKITKDTGSVSVWSGDGYAQIGSTLYGAVSGDYFGTAVSAGDINSDGKADLIIGVPGFDAPPILPATKLMKEAGGVQVLSGAGL